MATIVLPNFNTQKTMNGLNMYTYTIQNAGQHTVRMVVSHHSPSNLTASISQSGSMTVTLASVTVQPITIPNNNGMSSAILTAICNCAVSDVISFVLTSSAVNDKQLNNVRADMIVTR